MPEAILTQRYNVIGPGGSGHQFVLRAGSSLSIIVEGRYDIISWDPRGVNLTSPSLGCFEVCSFDMLILI